MNLKLSTKIFFLCLVVVGIAYSVSMFFVYSNTRNLLAETLIENKKTEILELGQGITSRIDELKNDVNFLASTPPIAGLKRTEKNGGVDSFDNSTEKQWKDRLSTIFTEMLYAKPHYSQIRLVSMRENGKELVRVERVGSKVKRAINENLQEKAGEYYFKEIVQANPNQTYMSKFSINREFGKVVYPVQMVTRAAVPIYHHYKDPFAFVIINIAYDKVIGQFLEIQDQDIDRAYFITDSEGVILNNQVDSDILMLDELESVTKKFPDYLKKINKTKNHFATVSFDEKNSLLVKKFYYDNANNKNFFTVNYVIDKELIQEKASGLAISNLKLIPLILIFVLMISLFFSNRISLPINLLSTHVKRMKDGFDVKDIDYKGNDEIGELVLSFNEMRAKLKEKNRQFESQRNALNQSTIVAETDARGRIIYANRSFQEISGYSEQELLGSDHRLLNSGHHPKSFFEEMWKTINSGFIWRGEVLNKNKDGELYWVDTTIYPVFDEKKKIEKFIAIRYEITDRKKLIDSLEVANNEIKEQREREIHASKVHAIGELSGSVAHEINNPLMIISANAHRLRKLMDKEVVDRDEAKKYANGLIKTSKRVSEIISCIKTLSRDGTDDDFEPETFKDLLGDVLIVSNNRLKGEEIEMRTEFSDDLEIFVGRVQFSQVIINLFNNALDAIKDEDEKWVKIEAKETASNVVISVSNSGPKIPEEIAKKVLLPFFTTKRGAKGTGIGLSIAKSIVEKHQGTFSLDDHSEYTKFDIVLPRKTALKKVS